MTKIELIKKKIKSILDTETNKLDFIERLKTFVDEQKQILSDENNINIILYEINKYSLTCSKNNYNIPGVKKIAVKYNCKVISYDDDNKYITDIYYDDNQNNWVDYTEFRSMVTLDDDWEFDESTDWEYGDWDDPHKHNAYIFVYLYYKTPINNKSFKNCIIITNDGILLESNNTNVYKYSKIEYTDKDIICTIDKLESKFDLCDIIETDINLKKIRLEKQKNYANYLFRLSIENKTVDSEFEPNFQKFIHNINDEEELRRYIKILTESAYFGTVINDDIINKKINYKKEMDLFFGELP